MIKDYFQVDKVKDKVDKKKESDNYLLNQEKSKLEKIVTYETLNFIEMLIHIVLYVSMWVNMIIH